MNKPPVCDVRRRGAAGYWPLLAAVALVVAMSPARVAAQRGREVSGVPSTFSAAAATASAAVVTLKLPGRAVLHGLLVDDWPDDEDLLD